MSDDTEWDFGFTSTTEEEINKFVVDDGYEKKYNEIRSIFLPLLKNLLKGADAQPYIHWPNRKEKITEVLDKLQKIHSAK
jgi:hypothetical protein